MMWLINLALMFAPGALITTLGNSISSVFSILASTFDIVATIFKTVSPIFQVIFRFVVWYIQEFFMGLKIIIQNPPTVAFILACLVVEGIILVNWENKTTRPELINPKPIAGKVISNGKRTSTKPKVITRTSRDTNAIIFPDLFN